MYAIKTGSKFLHVTYFIGPDVFSTKVSKNPKKYATIEAAEADIAAARKYFEARIAHMGKIAASAVYTSGRASASAVKLKAELEVLIEQPYKDVHATVARKLKELDKAEHTAQTDAYFAKDYNKTMTRFEKLAAADYAVVEVKQVVDTVLV